MGLELGHVASLLGLLLCLLLGPHLAPFTHLRPPLDPVA